MKLWGMMIEIISIRSFLGQISTIPQFLSSNGPSYPRFTAF